MNRLLAAFGLAIVLVGCTSATSPSQLASLPSPAASAVPATERAPLPATPTPAPTPADSIGPTGLVAYGLGDRIWVVNADGSDARELLPNVPGSQRPLAWSADGSRLLYSRGTPGGLALTDAAGSEPEEHELQCPAGADSDALLSSCQVDPAGLALSPDGRRLAYLIWEGTHDQGNREVTSVFVVLDLETGLVTRLELTEASAVGDLGLRRRQLRREPLPELVGRWDAPPVRAHQRSGNE